MPLSFTTLPCNLHALKPEPLRARRPCGGKERNLCANLVSNLLCVRSPALEPAPCTGPAQLF